MPSLGNEATEGELGSNLGDDIPVNNVVSTRVNKNHPVENIIGDPHTGVQTRHRVEACSSLYAMIKISGILHIFLYSCFISQVEWKNVQMALKDNSWVEAMQEELAQFQKLQVWTLVDLPVGEYAIGIRWVFK